MFARERIDIIVPEVELARNDEKRERLRRTMSFQPTERAPVVVNMNQWSLLAARGQSFGAYTRSARDNLREQILNRKWKLENIRDDEPMETEAMTLQPDLGCHRATEFEMEIVWPEDQPPKCRHPLTRPEEIDSLTVPDPDGGLNARRIEWYRAWLEMAEDFDVRLNGERLELRPTLGQQGGPIPHAFALAGSNLLLWVKTDPDRVHHLMEVVTTSHLRGMEFFDEMCGRPLQHAVGMGADAAEMLSPEDFREFALPYYLRVWEQYPGPRPLHMCGKIDHLLELLRDAMAITTLNGFGFPVSRQALAETMAGRVRLRGGPNPMLALTGPREALMEECIEYIRVVGCRGGFVLTTGGGVAAGTPVDHCHAMVEASRRAGPIAGNGKDAA